MLIGEKGAGKTATFRALVGLDFEQQHLSTVGADIHPPGDVVRTSSFEL